MGLLSAILVAIWLIGIVVVGYCTAYTLKHDQSEVATQVRLAIDVNPVVTLGFLALIIVAWPATLVFGLAVKKGK